MFNLLLEKEFNSINTGILIVDDGLNIIWANKVVNKFLAKNQEAILNLNINNINLLCPLSVKIRNYRENGINKQFSFSQNLYGIGENNNPLCIKVNFESTLFKNNWLGVITLIDESNFHYNQECIINSQRIYCLGTLMGGFAHDFNNVFTGIISHLDIASANPSCPEDIKNYLKVAESAARRGASVVNKLQFLVGSNTQGCALFDLADLIYETVFLMRHCLGRKIKIQDFEKPEKMCLVKADQNRIFQLIVNLCLNAKEAMPDGGTISFGLKEVEKSESSVQKSRKPGTYYMVTVTDTGLCIPENSREILSNSLQDVRFDKKGFGLGFYVSLKIIESAGGWIEIENNVENGTKVHFYIPAANVNYETIENSQQKTPFDNTFYERFSGNGSILVIDDEILIRQILKNTLSQANYNIAEAGSCSEAIDIISSKDHCFDLIFLDVNLNDGSGIEIIPQISKLSKAKIVLISGELIDNLTFKKVKNSVEAFLNKPFAPLDVLQITYSILVKKETENYV